MAFPLFENGHATGAMILLYRKPWVSDSRELCELAMMSGLMDRAINTQALARRLEETCAALDHELSAAAEVQRWLLPSNLPAVDGVSIASSYRTARRSGGDYYDVLQLPNGDLGILIADVSGKGAPAAVLTAVVRTIVHSRPSGWTSPAAVLDALDVKLCDLKLADRGAFVTAFCAILDPVTGRLTYSSAGHNPPRLLQRRQRIVVPLDGAGTTPLGLLDQPCTHAQEAMVLLPGDLAVLYTDGITEARSPEEQGEEFFSTTHLDEIMLSLPVQATPASAVEAIARAVSEFSGAGPISDDQTLLALSRRV